MPVCIGGPARVGAYMPPMPCGEVGASLSFCLSTLRLSLGCALDNLHFLLLVSCGYPKFSWTLSHLLAWLHSWIHLDLWWTVCTVPSLHTTTPRPHMHCWASTRHIFPAWEPHLLRLGGSSTDVNWLGFDAIGCLGWGDCPSTFRDLYCPQRVPPLCESFPVLWGPRGALQA